MRRPLLSVAVALLMSATLASCGDDDETGGGAKTDLADLAGEKIEVAAVWSGTEQERFTAVLEQFEKDTGAEVTFTSTGDDIGATLSPRIEAGDAPDVAMLPQPGLLNDFATQGALKPIEDVAGDLVDKNYSANWRELGTVNDELYGVWFKAANKSTVWYNVKAFEDAGVEPAKDWDTFLKDAQTLADSGVAPVSIGGADGWTLTDWFENVYLRTAGPDKYDQLTKHEIPWTDPSVVTALTTLGELWGKPELLTGGTQGALEADFPTSVQNVFADNAKGAIVYEGDFVAGVITEDVGAELGTDADFFSFPSVDGSKPAVVGGGDVAVLMTDNKAAKELIKYLATPEAAEIWAKAGGFLSPNKNVDTEVYPDEITGRLAEDLTGADTFRFDMSDLTPPAFGGTVGKGQWKALQDFLANPADVQGTAAKLEAEAAAAYATK